MSVQLALHVLNKTSHRYNDNFTGEGKTCFTFNTEDITFPSLPHASPNLHALLTGGGRRCCGGANKRSYVRFKREDRIKKNTQRLQAMKTL
ncbi:hypothetical protein AOLI_G00004510 [Acnodon oligacanthus]